MRFQVLLVTVLAAALLTGCAPEQPDLHTWRVDTRRALEGVASAASTVRMTLEQEADDDLLPGYAVTVAVGSEETLGTAQSTWSALQPPPGTARAETAAADAMERAAEAVRDARIALVAEDTDAYGELLRRLEEAVQALDEVRTGLSP